MEAISQVSAGRRGSLSQEASLPEQLSAVESLGNLRGRTRSQVSAFGNGKGPQRVNNGGVSPSTTYGLTTCSLPFSLRRRSTLVSSRAWRMAYVSLVPLGPATLRPETCSDAPILTDGRPRSVIKRNSTVSSCTVPSWEKLAGRTLMLAR